MATTQQSLPEPSLHVERAANRLACRGWLGQWVRVTYDRDLHPIINGSVHSEFDPTWYSVSINVSTLEGACECKGSTQHGGSCKHQQLLFMACGRINRPEGAVPGRSRKAAA